MSRPLMVARELRRRGHEVVFGGEGPFASLAAGEGFRVVRVSEPDPGAFLGGMREGRMRFVDDEGLAGLVEADLAAIGEAKPDLVLSDCRFSARISTAAAGVAHAAIVNAANTAHRGVPLFPLLAGVAVGSPLRRALDGASLAVERLVYETAVGAFRRVSRRHGLRRPVGVSAAFQGNDATLLADVPEFFPCRGLPAGFAYVGPLVWESRLPPPAWWPEATRADGRPLVYATMGSTGDPRFFRAAAAALAGAGLKAVLTTGGLATPVEPAAGALWLADFLDGDLAARACALVVCHGGNGTIYQALRQGRPVVGLPVTPGQGYQMRRVEALGLGRALPWRRFLRQPQALRRLVEEALADRALRARAEAFGERLRACDAPRAAAEKLAAQGLVAA